MPPRLTGIRAARKGQTPAGRTGAGMGRFAAAILAGLAGPLTGAAAPPESIGTWRLLCAEAGHDCVLRHKDASLQVAGYGAAVEVQAIDGALVPVVLMRGVGPQTAIGSMVSVAVWLRLDKGDWIEMPCNQDLRCLPQASAVAALARQFPAAALMRLRLDVTLPGGKGLPQPEHEFDLERTKQALARLQATGSVTAATPAAPGLDWKAMMQKLMKATGN